MMRPVFVNDIKAKTWIAGHDDGGCRSGRYGTR